MIVAYLLLAAPVVAALLFWGSWVWVAVAAVSQPSSMRRCKISAVLGSLLAQRRGDPAKQARARVILSTDQRRIPGGHLDRVAARTRRFGVPRPLSSASHAEGADVLGSGCAQRKPPPAPAAALIGRAAEVEDVLDLVGRARLVTLTGPPGVGKTRLAFGSARTATTWGWVDLAPIRDPRQVRAELARASRPDGYGSTDRLVVLDNCEHLLDSDLADQLASSALDCSAAGARHQPGAAPAGAEREYAVPPLPLPSDDDADDPPGCAATPPWRCSSTARHPPSS